MSPAEAARRLELLRAAVAKAVPKALTSVGARSVQMLKADMLTGQRLKVRSGRLRNSVGMDVGAGAAGVELEVWAGRGKDVKYAAIQEHGGIIRPKGKFLAIPVGPALTGAGVTRGGWESPRTAPVMLRFQPIRGGSMARLVIDGPKRSTTAYLLVRQVKIKAKHYMRDTERWAIKALPPTMNDQIIREVKRTGLE